MAAPALSDDSQPFNTYVACACAAMGFVSILGCLLASVHFACVQWTVGMAIILMAASLVPIYWQDKKQYRMRDASLIVPWGFLVAFMLPFSVAAAARLRMPLRDDWFVHLDTALGVNVPRINAWASHHWFGNFANRSYGLLPFLMLAAIVIPAFAGKLNHAREFLIANLIAFAIGLPLFALLPAVGPWYFSAFTPTSFQLQCQQQLLALRLPGPYLFIDPAQGVVCFPSFHVIWAVLCVPALSFFRWLRLLLIALCSLIIFSTITSGWHYFSDVVAGVAISFFSIYAAHILNARMSNSALAPLRDQDGIEVSASR